MKDYCDICYEKKELDSYSCNLGCDHNICAKCGGDCHWEDCYNCEDGYSHHDCGEDCCACRYPKANMECDVCGGKGGWFVCLSCGSNQNKPKVNQSLNNLQNKSNEVSGNSSHD